jgi:hypothetical protein
VQSQNRGVGVIILRAMTLSRLTLRSRTLLFILLIIAAGIALPRVARAQSGTEETPLCTVLKDPLAFDHKYVKVRGTIRLGYQDFTLHAADCATKPDIWLMFAGDVATPTESTGDDTERTPGANIVFAGSSFSLAKDDNFFKLFSLITARSDKNPLYRVTATLTGGFFAAGAKLLNSGGNKLTSAYGQLNCCNLLLITAVSEVESEPPASAAVDGTVVSESGTPLEGVTVINKTPTLQPQLRSTTTNSDGRFHIAYPGQVLQFRKDDLRPRTELLDLSASSVLVILHDSKASDWTIKSCTAEQVKQKRIGSDLLFELPSGAKFRKEGKRGPQTDFITYGNDSSGLRIEFDAKAAESETRADWLLSVSTDERWIKDSAGGILGIDAQGLWANNNRWRHATFKKQAAAEYATIATTATFYNQVIASACLAAAAQ